MKLELARGHLDYLEGMISQTEVELYVRIKPYYEFVEYIAAMPGITELKSVRIAKAGAYLKPLMVQCALVAITSKIQPYFAIKYGRIKKRRGHKKAIIAIARMMMVCIYHIVSEKQPFNPTDYEELMEPHDNQPKVILNDTTVFAYLTSQGYDTSLLVKCSDN